MEVLRGILGVPTMAHMWGCRRRSFFDKGGPEGSSRYSGANYRV